MGVDSFYFSKKAGKVIYVERFEDYCISAKHNFDSLGVENIEVINSDSRDIIEQIEDVDTFYIDPARRSDANKRIFAINECEPDVLAITGKLLSKAKNYIIQVSPMADIAFSLSLLPETTQVHTVSRKHDCK